MEHDCPYYDKCPYKMGDDTEYNVGCQEEGFISLGEEGTLCLAWDVVLKKEVTDESVGH